MATFPVRCFSCGKVLKPFSTFEENKNVFGSESKALDEMNIVRTCCRRMYKAHIPELEEYALQYPTKFRWGDGKTTS